MSQRAAGRLVDARRRRCRRRRARARSRNSRRRSGRTGRAFEVVADAVGGPDREPPARRPGRRRSSTRCRSRRRSRSRRAARRPSRPTHQLDVGVALTASAHGRPSSMSPPPCLRRDARSARSPAAAGGTDAATLPRRHRQARAWTATIGAPRSSPARCATPASRSIYTGLFQTPEQVAEAALQEDADAVGLSLLSGAHMTLIPKIVDELRDRGLDDVLVFAGGIIPDDDITTLRDGGVAAVFTPGIASSRRSPAGSNRALDSRETGSGAIASRHPGARWICSSTRASSCSRALRHPGVGR